jgi:hypothetical protein
MCPALVVTNSRSRAPDAVETLCSSTGAPSATAGRDTWNFKTRAATLLGAIVVSRLLLPLCAGSPLNCSQS